LQNIKSYEAMVKLDLPDEQRQWVSGCADMLIQSFEQLRDIDVSGVQPMVTVLDIHSVLREDTSVKVISREELLSNAPEQYDGYFQAPKILD